MRADIEERLRALILEASDAIDPARQGDCWPDPVAWGPPDLSDHAGMILTLVEGHIPGEYDIPASNEPDWADLAERLSYAIDDAILDGRALREHRAALGMTQAELAVQLGVAPNTVARWERGERRIEHPRLVRLALMALARA